MNKKQFVNKLSEKTNYDNEKCTLINDILEENFLLGKKNKEKIIIGLKEKLGIDDKEANNIYNVSMDIVSNELKEKIKHPFKSLD